MRSHLQHVQTSTGTRPPELETPDAPASVRHVLDHFNEIATGRQAGLGGPLPLAWGEIGCWQSLTGTVLEPWEVRLLRALDLVWMDVWQKCQSAAPKSSPSQRAPASGAR